MQLMSAITGIFFIFGVGNKSCQLSGEFRQPVKEKYGEQGDKQKSSSQLLKK